MNLGEMCGCRTLQPVSGTGGTDAALLHMTEVSSGFQHRSVGLFFRGLRGLRNPKELARS